MRLLDLSFRSRICGNHDSGRTGLFNQDTSFHARARLDPSVVTTAQANALPRAIGPGRTREGSVSHQSVRFIDAYKRTSPDPDSHEASRKANACHGGNPQLPWSSSVPSEASGVIFDSRRTSPDARVLPCH
ncbi:hypothetical protein MN608_05276 [Microdochium nivale]|nr:hypothetical protein MN608_05276 [Microdochium nivale]